MNIVAVANQKGGVGKTTTAVNLSVCLAQRGKRILLIDLDPQGNASSALGVENEDETSLYNSLISEEPISNSIIETRFPTLSIVPANMDLAGAEIEVARMDRHLTRLREVMVSLKASDRFDTVFMDCPPSLGILMTNALAACDEILVPLQCEYFALEGLSKIVRVVEQIKESGANPDLAIGGILMTMYDSRTNLSQQVVEEVRKHFGSIVYQTLIPRSIRLGEAPSFGKAIIEYDPKSPGAIAYESLAVEYLQRKDGTIKFVNSTDIQDEVTDQ